MHVLVFGDESRYLIGDVLQELEVTGVGSPYDVAEYDEERTEGV
jgi:hypothetical protein